MIGQMIISGFRGLDLIKDNPIIRDIENFNLGGVILYDEDVADPTLETRNISSPEQVKELIQSLKLISDETLIVSIDQEGGEVQRLKPKYGFPECPSWGEVGKQNDENVTRQFSTTIAHTLSSIGCNLNFAPVLDLDISSRAFLPREGRCFNRDPEVVGNHARLFIEEHLNVNILPVIKHFPGLGSASADTHEGLTDITDTWSNKELEPYRILFDSVEIPAVMVGHCFHKDLDSDWPASMSNNIITKLLRENLGFKGIVICDDPMMGAIANQYPLDVVLEKMINAGVDLFCFGNNLVYDIDIVPKVINTIESLLKNGKISQTRIDEALFRISLLKLKIA